MGLPDNVDDKNEHGMAISFQNLRFKSWTVQLPEVGIRNP